MIILHLIATNATNFRECAGVALKVGLPTEFVEISAKGAKINYTGFFGTGQQKIRGIREIRGKIRG